ncbi:hypothetical protein H7A76_30630 [Pseudomonas sp. MSSRFD41]|uniref:phage tail tip lysozyme n=1 Tax=Pseudomonas sp. MSSRFD41 TaxID=1310370 RepID=UPI00163B4EE3|nr:phage tail tip lysozyme [Pseudomonas sp. MSSRFD41]MBC2659812.1 hypothetical protein [Pseudomonas sp. MSSRFD41]
MADQEVMREFLVGLGFKVDKQGMKSFTDGVDGATKAVKNLVTAITGASLAVAAGVSAFASNLEGLYFASQRIGSSATSIKSAEYAARDLGASASEARGSLESMARFLRENPGGERFLQGIGVQTREANGELRDTADLMVGLGNRLRSMPWYQAKQYAGILGIDDNTLRAIISGDFGRKLEENRKRLAGSGLDRASKDAHAFMEALRGLMLQFESFSIRVQAALMQRLGPELARFSEWFEKNAPMIADRVADIVIKLVEMAEKAGPYLQQIWQFFVDLDTATDGWSTKLLALLWVLNAIGATAVIAGITKLASAFFRLGSGIASVATASLLLKGDVSDSSKEAQGLQDQAMAGSREAAIALARKQFENQWWRKWFGGTSEDDVQKRADEIMAGVHAGSPKKDVMASASNKDRASFYTDFLESLGVSREMAIGMIANGIAESNLDPKAIGDGGAARGIFQLHPDRQKNFEKWSGFNIRDDRADEFKQMEFAVYELTQGAEQRAGKLMRAAQNSRAAAEIGSQYWLRPRDTEREARNRGEIASQLNQTTTINVYGANDPNATASAVAGAQKQVTQDMRRNLSNPVN